VSALAMGLLSIEVIDEAAKVSTTRTLSVNLVLLPRC
jgi:hypothetical protein